MGHGEPASVGERVSREPQRVLFLQGGGEGVHDEWDSRMVASLAEALGPGFDIAYPRMPAEHDPSGAAWCPVIHAALDALGPGGVVVAHSVGGTLLLRCLLDGGAPAPAAVVLVAAPFVGERGWSFDDLSFTSHPARLSPGVALHVVHGLADDEVPAAHAELFAAWAPHARVHLLPGRDHQLGDDLTQVADLVRAAVKPGP